jgi:hypothetical protein
MIWRHFNRLVLIVVLKVMLKYIQGLLGLFVLNGSPFGCKVATSDINLLLNDLVIHWTVF